MQNLKWYNNRLIRKLNLLSSLSLAIEQFYFLDHFWINLTNQFLGPISATEM